MRDPYEICGCEESKYLRTAIREYMEKNDDTGLRCEYGAPPQLNTIEKLRHVDMPLSIEDRRQIYAEIVRLRKRDIPVGSKLTDVIKTARVGAAREALEAVAEVAKQCHLTLDPAWIETWLSAQKPGW